MSDKNIVVIPSGSVLTKEQTDMIYKLAENVDKFIELEKTIDKFNNVFNGYVRPVSLESSIQGEIKELNNKINWAVQYWAEHEVKKTAENNNT